MKILNQVKKFLNITFALFTCLAFALIIVYKTLGISGGIMWAWSDIEKMFADILVFALCAGASVTVIDVIPRLPSVIKYILKFGLIYVAFWFWMLDGASVNGSQKMIMSTVYLIVYAVIAVLGAILSYVERKLTGMEPEYKSVYAGSGVDASDDGGNGKK